MMERRPLKKRLGESFAAALMWIVFGAMAVAFLVLMPLLILRYAVTGKPAHRDAVKLPGKSLDQFCNAAWFGGHPKETVSAHCGRYFEAKYGNPYEGLQPTDPSTQIPAWAHLVRWVTDLAEKDHVLKAIEPPFRGMPL